MLARIGSVSALGGFFFGPLSYNKNSPQKLWYQHLNQSRNKGPMQYGLVRNLSNFEGKQFRMKGYKIDLHSKVKKIRLKSHFCDNFPKLKFRKIMQYMHYEFSEYGMKKSTEYESEAFKFLRSYNVPKIKRAFTLIVAICPKFFQLTQFEIGQSILNLKNAGISENRIQLIIEYLALAFFAKKNQYFIDVCKLFQKELNLDHIDDSVDIITNVLYDKGNFWISKKLIFMSKQFFLHGLKNFEEKIQILLKYVEKHEITRLLRSNPHLYLFIKSQDLEVHLKNFTLLIDFAIEYYYQDYLGQFDLEIDREREKKSLKQSIYFYNLKSLSFLILTDDDIEDIAKKLSYYHEMGCTFFSQMNLYDLNNFFYYDLDNFIKPRFEFAKQRGKLKYLNYYNSESADQILIQKLFTLDSDSWFSNQLRLGPSKYPKFLKRYKEKLKQKLLQ
eukprot:TRINITY_DN9592_c1_g2_i1.p1 TRINITY_DN9592_c1_g2~~TRINITY_DN9592_c1_g2_i1.p1  ORF type:complete len:467 (+),score=46.28 TRINITY_DN9592_c1_g2_i1:71-1402(+)